MFLLIFDQLGCVNDVPACCIIDEWWSKTISYTIYSNFGIKESLLLIQKWLCQYAELCKNQIKTKPESTIKYFDNIKESTETNLSWFLK